MRMRMHKNLHKLIHATRVSPADFSFHISTHFHFMHTLFSSLFHQHAGFTTTASQHMHVIPMIGLFIVLQDD